MLQRKWLWKEQIKEKKEIKEIEKSCNKCTNVQRFECSKNCKRAKNVAVNTKNRSKIDVRGNAQGTARTANGKKERAEA